MATLTLTSPTTIKARPIQSANLADQEKVFVVEGCEIDVEKWQLERNHIRFVLSDTGLKLLQSLKPNLGDSDRWYAFAEHASVTEAGKVHFPQQMSPFVKLSIPYKSQLDNKRNPRGSCNVTSMAMAMEYLGAQRKMTGGQFEDELYNYAEDHNLSRHKPADLATISHNYGIPDQFRTDGGINDAKKWLASGKPCVIHGYFTSFGHIVCLTGYDDSGFWVHDPYGEWCESGYILNQPGITTGRYVHYSNSLIQRLCIPDGQFWVHFLG